MSDKPADRQTLGELNSALLLINERGTPSLQLVGWVAHPRAVAVLLEVGLSPNEIFLCTPEARPDVSRLLPYIDPDRIFGFRTTIPVPRSQKFSSLLHVYGVMTLSNGEQEAISFAVARPREVRVSPPPPEQTAVGGGNFAAVSELLLQRKRLEHPVPSFLPGSDSPDLSIIVHGDTEPSFLHSHLESLRKMLPGSTAELIHAGSDSTVEPLFKFCAPPETKTERASLPHLLNQTVGRARGKYLLFISSHGLLRAPAVLKALAVADSIASLGALGGSIYSPQGSLLERGSRFLLEGHALRRNADESPAADYVSQVDFVSRHFLLTPKEVFTQLGGFENTSFFDADYCYRARERGLNVLVDPAVVHVSAENEHTWFGEPDTELVKTEGRQFAARHFTGRSGKRDAVTLPPLFLFAAPESMGLADEERLFRIAREATALGYLPTLVCFGRNKSITEELIRLAPPSLSCLEFRRPKDLTQFLHAHASRAFVAWLTPGPLVRLFEAAIDYGNQLAPESAVILDLRGAALDQTADAECLTPYFLEGRLGVPADCAESTLQMADTVIVGNSGNAKLLTAAGIDEHRVLVDSSTVGDPKTSAAALAFASGPRRRPWRYPALRQLDPVRLGKRRNYSASAPSTIDIIIPVFNAFEQTRECIDRVLKNTDQAFRLIVIDDASTDPQIAGYLQSLPFLPQPPLLVDLQVVRNDLNLGFVRSVNRGLIASRNDAVILNSDTEVPPGWLSRFASPLKTFPSIGSCTPFSNCATICSFPSLSQSNPIPAGITGDEIDEYCQKLPDKNPIEIPTGVGFCMLLSRIALDAVGLFDPVLFGRGYGEENDWCVRAAQRGFRHVLTPGVFVAHHEGSSFSVLKDRLAHIESHVERVQALWPDYLPAIAQFEQSDPIKETRERLTRMIVRARGPEQGTLYISHADLGGGSAHYLRHRMLQRKSSERQFGLHIDAERALLLIFGDSLPCDQAIELSRINVNWFNQLLDELGINEIFVNQLAGLDAPLITDLLLGAKVPFTFFVHDYFAACPSVNLLNARNEYCKNEKRIEVCRSCQARGFSRVEIVSDEIAHHDLVDWRDRFGRVLARAAHVIAPSNAAAEVIRSYYPAVTIEVEHHEAHHTLSRTFETAFGEQERLRVTVLGAIAKNKGSELLLELARLIRRDKLPIDLTILGYTNLGDDAPSNITVTGEYAPEQISKLLAEQRTSLVLIPSIWPETFSYTTLEALGSGYPVMCFNIGGGAEQVRQSRGGWTVDECSAPAILRELRRIVEQRDEIRSRAQLLLAWSALHGRADEVRNDTQVSV